MNALIRKTRRLLQQQEEAFRLLEGEMAGDKLLPLALRRHWSKLQRLQRAIVEECLPGLAGENVAPGDAATLELLTRFFRYFEEHSPSLQTFLGGLARAIDADRGLLIACSEQSSQVSLLAAVNVRDPNLTLEQFQMSRTVFRQVMRFRQSVLIPNALADPAYNAQHSIAQAETHSILATPFSRSEAVSGILYFESSKVHKGFTEETRAFIEAVRPMMRHFFPASTVGVQAPSSEEVFLEQEKVAHGLIGTDPAFTQAISLLQKAAASTATILLNGESGTGKELFARAAHALSPRRRGPFVPVNCAAIPESLLESELFGHEKGAFTGADAARMGTIERASQGTLFLDEVSELRPELQAKLLRVLQSHEIERVGGRGPIAVDVRVVAATNQDLTAMVREGKFRQDLFFRLNVFPIVLPPLRKRQSDIRPLARHFMQKYADLLGLRQVDVSPEVWSRLEGYAFPGNVRELENLIYRALLMSSNGRVTLESLAEELLPGRAEQDLDKNPFSHLHAQTPEDYAELCRRREEIKDISRSEIAFMERRFAERLLNAAGGNVSQAAKEAGIDRGLFYRLLKPETSD